MAIELGSGAGSGSHLPAPVLSLAGLCTLVAVVVSAISIHLHLRNYRRSVLQRMVVRIMVMVPLYAVSSMVSIFSLDAAFFIDALRDIYEAFVIYCFFVLLLEYLGGERSLLIALHGRPPQELVFPLSLFKREIDVSDPYTFLFLKRGIMQYVQVKPVLAVVTLVLKACNKYNDGDLRANSGYLYVSLIYNVSICLSLYCLAVFWICVNEDLKPFRPVPKFLCVKGILFFSFWQSLGISILVAAEVIKKLGPYTDTQRISLGLTDTLICFEMPLFAIAHLYAFSYTDFVDPFKTYAARMPMWYAARDAFGFKDVVEDFKATLRGEGMDYREFEPSEGHIHQGVGRYNRIRAGLRYSKGGKKKYWLPRTGRQGELAHAPLLADADGVVHDAPDIRDDEPDIWSRGDRESDELYELAFPDIDNDPEDDQLYAYAKKYFFGDYNYPCVDVSTEGARRRMWIEEEQVLHDERSAWYSSLRGAKGRQYLEQRQQPVWQGYGAVASTSRAESTARRMFDEFGDAAVLSTSQRPAVSLHMRQDRPSPFFASSPVSPRARSTSRPAAGRSQLQRSSPGSDRHTSLLPARMSSDAIDLIVEHDSARQRKLSMPNGSASNLGLRTVYASDADHDVVHRPSSSSIESGVLSLANEPESNAETAVTLETIAVRPPNSPFARPHTPPFASTQSWRYEAVNDNPWA